MSIACLSFFRFPQSIAGAGVTYKNENWHKECFTCHNCNTALAGQRFTIRDDKTLCAECFGTMFAKKCEGCTKPIIAAGSLPDVTSNLFLF